MFTGGADYTRQSVLIGPRKDPAKVGTLNTCPDKNAAEALAPAASLLAGALTLGSGCVLAVKLCAQTIEVRIKRDKACRSLKEGPPAGFTRHAIQRALTVTRGEIAVTGQANRRRVERKDRDVTFIRFSDCAVDVQRATRRRHVESVRDVESVGD